MPSSVVPRPVPCLLVTHGSPQAVRRWLAGGLVEAVLAPTEQGWQLCAPSYGASDDDRTVFLNRPVPRRLAPAVGFLQVGETALVVVHDEGLRPTARWIAWRPGIGVIDAAPLAQAAPADLLRAVGVRDREEVAAVMQVLRDDLGDAASFLEDLAVVLGLPGHEVLAGHKELSGLHGAEEVVADEDARESFAGLVEEEQWWHDELERVDAGDGPPRPPTSTGLPRLRTILRARRPKEKP